MPAFVQLPWLNSSDQFLKAIQSGAEFGLNRARLQQASMSHGGGGGLSVARGPSALEQAQVEALKSKTDNEEADRQTEAEARGTYSDLIRRGETPQRAFEIAGLGRFDTKGFQQPKSPFTLFNGPRGEITAVNRDTLQPLVVSPGSAGKDKYYNIPMSEDLLGKTASSVPMTLDQLNKNFGSLPQFARTNAVTSTLRNMSGGGSSGLQEGQRVRNKTTGKMGTVINGQVVPDEDIQSMTSGMDQGEQPAGMEPGQTYFGQ